jgi:altronate hydrolase
MTKLAIRIDPKDNVAMAMERLTAGEVLSVLSDEAHEVDRVTITAEVPLAYHKIALARIDKGDPILKYGEIIGYATARIERGEWVHLHNVESVNYRERDRAGSKTDG